MTTTSTTESDGDVCVCMHARDWHHDGGCNAFATADRSCGARCLCEGFVLHHTAEADELARWLRSAIDSMEGAGEHGLKGLRQLKSFMYTIGEDD